MTFIDDKTKAVVIFGATSAIAQACARIWAERGYVFFLVGRDLEKLKRIADDLKTRGARNVHFAAADLNHTEQHSALLAQARERLGSLQTVLVAQGTLGEQTTAQADFTAARTIVETNFLGPVSLLTLIANEMETQKSGTIAVISSVAGERGRRSNYVYGSAKGALSLFLQGLRNRLATSGVTVVTIKPGFVDTPMTRNFKKGVLWASAARIGHGIVRAMDQRKSEVYLPHFWRFIMFLIRLVPECVGKRLKW